MFENWLLLKLKISCIWDIILETSLGFIKGKAKDQLAYINLYSNNFIYSKPKYRHIRYDGQNHFHVNLSLSLSINLSIYLSTYLCGLSPTNNRNDLKHKWDGSQWPESWSWQSLQISQGLQGARNIDREKFSPSCILSVQMSLWVQIFSNLHLFQVLQCLISALSKVGKDIWYNV